MRMSGADCPIHEEIPSGESAALINLLNRAQFKSLRRAAWLPVTKELKTARCFFARRDSVKATGSRYGGVPWLGIREAWPLCQYCKRPMQFFFRSTCRKRLLRLRLSTATVWFSSSIARVLIAW